MPKVILGKPKDPEKWEAAKEKAAEQGHAEEYDYIMAIYKKMAHLGKSVVDVVLLGTYTRKVNCRCGKLLLKSKGPPRNVQVRCKRCGRMYSY